MKYSLIIWDFNGTILDDLELSLNSINEVLKRRKLSLIKDKAAYRTKFGFPIENYYRSLGMDFDREPYKIPADEWVKLYNDGKNELGLTDGVKAVIDFITENNIPQWILSASEQNLLNEQLTRLGIFDKFQQVLGCKDVYAHGKVEMAKDFATKTGADLSTALLIGDTDHDFETAKALGCDCVLYDKGHMDSERLKSTGSVVIDDMSKLFKLL